MNTPKRKSSIATATPGRWCLGLVLITALFALNASSRPTQTPPAPCLAGLTWATYLGTENYDVPEAMALAPDGTVVVAGFIYIFATDGIDGFVARFSADGTTLLNWLVLDGSSIDGPFGLGVDQEGVITVAGQTESADFPVTADALQPEKAAGADGFIMQLSPDFEIIYSTFLGGDGEEAIVDLAMDAEGGFAVCGYTASTDFPVTDGAFQTQLGGGFDAFAAKFSVNPSGPPWVQLDYSTYLGGTSDDADGSNQDERLLRQAVGLTASGKIVVGGMTWSEDFPTTPNAWQTSHTPLTGVYTEDADIFVAVLDPKQVGQSAASQLEYSTLIGGGARDLAEDLVVHGAKVTLVGLSRSADFPVTSDALQPELRGWQDAVVVQMKVNSATEPKNQLVYSTYYGGAEGGNVATPGRDAANMVYRMDSGDIVVGGVTTATDFPTTDGSVNQGAADGFLLRLDTSRPTADQLILSRLFGGSGTEPLCVGPVGTGKGDIFFCGDTTSADLPVTPGVYDETYNGGYFDIYVARYCVGPNNYADGVDCCDAIEALIELVEASVGGQQQRTLIRHLEESCKRFALNKSPSAIQFLRSFQDKVAHLDLMSQKWPKKAMLDHEAALQLIEAAQAIIDSGGMNP